MDVWAFLLNFPSTFSYIICVKPFKIMSTLVYAIGLGIMLGIFDYLEKE